MRIHLHVRVVAGVVVLVLALAVTACAKAPDSVAVGGAPLRKAQEAKLASGVSFAVYTPDGNESGINDAAKKLTVYFTDAKTAPSDLRDQVLAVYQSRLSAERWLVASLDARACMVGRNLQNGHFSVQHVSCTTTTKSKRTGCAVAEETMPVPCNTGDDGCKDAKSKELCGTAPNDDLTAQLDDAVARVAH